jgi:hypothetical protein
MFLRHDTNTGFGRPWRLLYIMLDHHIPSFGSIRVQEKGAPNKSACRNWLHIFNIMNYMIIMMSNQTSPRTIAPGD